MRILAVRGENLASLAGPFAVDFAKPPLRDAGLFAITGPTGAGKSTLLDALCLALYDRTPRLDQRQSTVRVGRPEEHEDDRLGTHDVRGILRRGAAHGFAEVDFVGRGGRLCRARWEVRRARGKETGALQTQEMALWLLDEGKVIAGKRKEVLAAIEEHVGLSFEQFRRSVLLAQGEFAAFLRAKSSERASLLEQMTGMDLYGRLSVAAFARGQAERLRVASLSAELERAVVLEPEARAALEAELAATEERRAAWKRELDDREAARVVLEAATRLTERLREAVSLQDGLVAAHAVAAPRRARLATLERARSLAPVVAALRAAEREEAAARGALAQARTASAAARKAQGAAEALRVAALAERDEAEERASALAPALAEADRVDGELALARRELAESEAVLASRRSELDAHGAELAVLSSRTDEARARAHKLAEAAAKASRGRALAEGWTMLAERLERVFELLDQGASPLADGVDAPALEDAATRAEAAAEEREAALAALRGRSLDAARRSLVEEELVVRDLATLLAEARELESERVRLTAEAQSHASAGEDDESKARAHRREASRLGRAAEKAQRDLEAARLGASFATARTSLTPGEPCPLCGATEHPYAGHGHGAPPDLGALEAAATTLTAAAQRAAQEHVRLDERAKAAFARAAEKRRRVQEIGTALQVRREQWQKELRAFPHVAGGWDVQDPLAASSLERARESLAARLQTLRAEEDERTRLELEAQRARREAQDARRIADATRLGRGLERELAGLEGVLGPPAGWRPGLLAEGRTFRERLRAEVSRYETLVRERDAAEAAVVPLAAARDAREREAHAAERLWSAAAEAREARARAAAALLARRSTLLEGRPTNAVREALAASVAKAVAGLAHAERASTAAREADARAARDLAGAEARHAAAGAALAEALERLEEEGRRAGLTPEDVRAAVETSDAALAEERAALAQLDTDLRAAEERVRVLAEEHKALAAPPEPAAALVALDAELGTLRDRLAAASEAAVALRTRRASDDEARLVRAARAEDLAAQAERTATWTALADLLGSQNGDKFRRFAQGLTFEALLGAANEHLSDFAPRYALMRVPGTDLEMQVVDRDMGDDIRSVASLSGGESFLVSLALALGLSRLGAGATRIESLFIDEGFGTLDGATLETAFDALEALQATGRTVGIVTHVPSLEHRIAARIRVQRRGPGRSAVVVEGAGEVTSPEQASPEQASAEPPVAGSGARV